MATQSQAACQHTIPEVQELRRTVESMDSLSQEGFSEISFIAKIAISALKTPGGYQHMDDIANAFKAIWVRADDIRNCINCEAESVGCNYTNDDQRRRQDALHQIGEADMGQTDFQHCQAGVIDNSQQSPLQDTSVTTELVELNWLESGNKLNEAKKMVEFLSKAATADGDSYIPGPGYSEGLFYIFMDVLSRLGTVEQYHDSMRAAS